ncbi:TonB-dependent siderophore receptor [Insolitispirillum peregrinum]|uniref:TonB-dependent siderophore receptor n=1 Tax=Insolitispirillum peregrinum TaxID=80876 RepID=UPI00361297D3
MTLGGLTTSTARPARPVRASALFARCSGWALITSLLLAAPAALAQTATSGTTTTRAFSIPAQPLAQAVMQFGQQAGMQISADAALLTGKRSSGVSGSLSPEQALLRLLDSTGVGYRLVNGSTAVLYALPADQSSQALQLAPVVVSAAGAQGMGTVGEPPVAYAGKQVARGGRLGSLGNSDMMDNAFSVTSFTEDLMTNQQAETISDVLANDPAVRTSYGYGNFSEQFVIRGFPLNADDISVDGLYGLSPRQIVGTELYERVEVLRGANAFLNGVSPSGSGIGGGVNLLPKRAGNTPLTRLTTTYGMDSRVGAHLDVGRRFGDQQEWGARANLVMRDGNTAIDDERRSTQIIALGLDRQGEDTRVSLDLNRQNIRIDQGRPVVYLNGSQVPKAPDASSNYAQGWTFSEMTDTTAQMRIEHDLTDALMAYAAFGGRMMREDGSYSSPTVNSNGVGTMRRMDVPREDTTLTGQAGLRAKATTGAVGHQIDLGASSLDTTNRNSYEMSGTVVANLYAPIDVATPRTTTTGGDQTNLPKVSQSHMRSLFASDTLAFLDDRVLLTAGLRQQMIHVEGYSRTTGERTSNYSDDAMTPVVGLVVKPTERLSLYANRIEGLAPGPTAPSTAANSGEMFEPYKSVQYEVGAKLDYGSIGGSVAVFQTTQPTGVTDPTTRVYSVDGEQRNRGIELMAFGEPLEGVRLLGGVTLLQTRLSGTAGGINDGNDAVGVPNYQANLGAEWDPEFLPNVTLFARVLHTGSQYVDAANTLKVPDWSRLDVGGRYTTEINSLPVAFRANIENLTDESYWASANGGYLTLGNPLTAKLSVAVDF